MNLVGIRGGRGLLSVELEESGSGEESEERMPERMAVPRAPR